MHVSGHFVYASKHCVTQHSDVALPQHIGEKMVVYYPFET